MLSDEFNGPYVQVDGDAEVIDLPDAVEPLVDYFRAIAGEHPDWDEYRQAMVDQGKCLIRVTPRRWGPVATGGFPPPGSGVRRRRDRASRSRPGRRGTCRCRSRRELVGARHDAQRRGGGPVRERAVV